MISIVIPVYNSENYLKDCIDSILGQTYGDIEVICVDDGSTDSSLKILDCYGKQDSRLKVFSKEHVDGTGAGAARNLGLRQANGDYICFLDSDDFFERDMLKKAYEYLTKAEADIVMWDAWEYDMQKQCDKEMTRAINSYFLPNDIEEFSPSEYGDVLFQITAGQAWNIMLDMGFLKEKGLSFQETRYTDDILFTYTALTQAEKVAVIRERMVHYRTNFSSQQSSIRYQYLNIMYAGAAAVKEELAARGCFERFKATYYNRFMLHMMEFLDNQRDYEAFEKAYDMLNKKLKDELELSGYLELPREKIYRYKDYVEFKRMQGKDAGEYLYECKKGCKEQRNILLPSKLKNKRVVLYGGGRNGKEIFASVLHSSFCRVIGWADRNYLVLGYPMMNPEQIKELDYEYIYVTVSNREIQKEIVDYLINVCKASIENIVCTEL